MATSNSFDFSVSRDDIIKAAYRKVLVDEDFTPSTAQTNNAALLLNGIVKSFEAILGVPLWSISNYVFLPTSGRSFNLGPTGSNITTSYNTTTLSASSSSGASTITVTSTTGISDTYYIGIELDSGSMQWTTVSGAPAGSVVTLSTTLSGDASSGNRVYCYQTKAQRPLRIVYAYARLQSEVLDIPIRVVTLEEWSSYSNKASTSNYPLVISYQPTLDNGTLRIWPMFNSGDYVIVMNAVRPLADFDATGDTPDFPQEWYLPLIYELACALAPDYSVPLDKYRILRKEADRWFSEVSKNDYEEGSIYFQPASNPYRM